MQGLKAGVVFAVLVAVTGCSGLDYAVSNYSKVKPVQFTYAGNTFRVYDRPDENRLMITPQVGDRSGANALKGAAQGAAGGLAGSEGTYRSASDAYFSGTGRQCEVNRIERIVEPQWEVFYTCRG
ncbi:hypothetical protein R3X27_24860 [Tropicimonas sp. TH_r6]|uniref:hypothetical protein n=1 Tax=Tropicimonas sp. TH_r6 TaxID=3082085 RepID=UPI002955975C|nr:hypothetical protein [Tropicimonas sp. TH_r6]MDV7145920.1 hypothetical protein [Tropicimonas sp. TH_r6]